ncbi:Trypsin family protein with PDZ domain-containing protein [Arabidopsis thaliana]|uniref:Trypsin family protein with PDZ domain-containing protein n=1 Tax=Arabidopsis thaliana TaxID=3702 RepID=F4KFV6_ARATH|nr:Trypsin family protein with PDZ domain-containing protein [Arabidopsis thaliana]AED94481.1 Trypsin family protein with PDZ domain-containing protein [Arabidopsis thaliana]|eukprot:NP_974863.1 Trypsin family protein with PDZ domain-containing protein [Arabidopsis thaliana]
MQVIASFCSKPNENEFVGRRQLLSSVCSKISQGDVVSHPPVSSVKVTQDWKSNLHELAVKSVPSTTRRILLTSLFMNLCFNPSRYLSALALGDPSVATVEDVSPTVFPAGPLFPTEGRIVQLFEKNTYSVVNIFDVTLRPQLKMTGVVEIPEGNGSGVVWDGQGYIVTNYHVIGNALSRNPSPGDVVGRVNILASDGVQKNFEGKLVGADRAKDLAVLKVDAPETLLKPIKVGQSNSLKVGQQCLAIGNPFGFDHTLTVGVISGLNRDIFSQTGVTIGGGIQTDAAINPGNSGGPLLDSKGNLIGINTAIFTQTVLKIVPQLIQFSKVLRAGINIELAPDPVANQLNVRNGALVLQVPGKSLAEKAGLHPTSRGFAGNIVLGDIIVAVDDKPVKNKAELMKILDEYSVGDKVTLKIKRGNEDLELKISLEEKSS